MNVYEREYFVSRIRSGFYHIKDGNTKIKVMTPTMEDDFFANEHFMEVLEEAKLEGYMTQDQMLNWMMTQGLWSEKKEKDIETVKKDIDGTKLKMYKRRSEPNIVQGGKQVLEMLNSSLNKLLSQKDEYFSNTCEGLAFQEKSLFLFERCCYVGKERFDFNSLDPTIYYYSWLGQLLKEGQVRELARNDPWRHYWLFKEDVSLFNNEGGRDLSVDQKNIMVWSKMYDNVQESPERPSEEVIEDDDLLDGWFIYQREKEKEESVKNDIEDKINNPKMANAQEFVIMAKDQNDVDNINKLNTPIALRNKKERINTVKAKGNATDLDFKDKQMEIRNQSNEMFKNKFRR